MYTNLPTMSYYCLTRHPQQPHTSFIRVLTMIIILVALISCGESTLMNKSLETFTPPDVEIYYGDSITFLCVPEISGISYAVIGDTSVQMLELVTQYTPQDNPSIYHILIGTNDISINIHGSLLSRLDKAMSILDGTVYVMSILPTNNTIKNDNIKIMNEYIKKLVINRGHEFLDTYNIMLDKKGILNPLYSNDGLHLNNLGCDKLFN